MFPIPSFLRFTLRRIGSGGIAPPDFVLWSTPLHRSRSTSLHFIFFKDFAPSSARFWHGCCLAALPQQSIVGTIVALPCQPSIWTILARSLTHSGSFSPTQPGLSALRRSSGAGDARRFSDQAATGTKPINQGAAHRRNKLLPPAITSHTAITQALHRRFLTLQPKPIDITPSSCYIRSPSSSSLPQPDFLKRWFTTPDSDLI